MRRFKKNYDGICFIKRYENEEESRHFTGAKFDGEDFCLNLIYVKQIIDVSDGKLNKDIVIDESVQEVVTEFKNANSNMFGFIGEKIRD